MKTLILFIIVLTLFYPGLSLSQKSGTVRYRTWFNGSLQEDIPEIVMCFKDNVCEITNISGKSIEKIYFDYAGRKTCQTFVNKDGTRYTVIDSFESYPRPELKNDTDVINGYKCKKSHVVIRSNQIDIFHTEEAGIKGSPVINMGHDLGLVLKIVRNGNYEIRATNITFEDCEAKLPDGLGEVVDLPAYKEKITGNNFTTVQVFSREKINYGDTIVNPPENLENVTYRYSNGTVIMKKVRLPLNVKGSLVFAELSEMSDGDAYDRTGTVFVIPYAGVTMLDALKGGLDKVPLIKDSKGNEYQGMIALENYLPSVELIRFITPFGINKYNDQVKVKGIRWEDSVVYRQDVTDLLPCLTDYVWIGVFIGNYDKGGHIVSLKLNYHPDDINAEEQPLDDKYWIMPLANSVNIMETSGQNYGRIFENDTLSVDFNVPAGIKDLKLRYISTGHGGWGNGDEFNKKKNEIFIDNKPVFSFIPWRDDCSMYRRFNPASGNFPNGISSSDYSRSGWCPGSTSVPVDILLNEMEPGKHTFKVFIPMGRPEGTSFSSWNISAVLIGRYQK